MNPHDYCQQKAAASGSSFTISFTLLPQEKKQAMTALYAFCREVDDVVDEVEDPQVAAIKLAWWRQEVERLYDGTPQHPVAQALAEVIKTIPLDKELLLEIIDGMEMDLTQARYADFKSLQLYCYRVASVVGLLSAEIFGMTERATRKYAHDLGMAFQLTNIIRDVGEDARRGRIYLPMDELQRFNVPAADILNSRPTEAFAALMQFQIERARGFYEQAFAALPAADRRKQKPGLVMAAIYRSLLEEIAAEPGLVLTHRISIPPGRKAWLALKAWIKG
jgi:phytoene synthase